MGRDKAARARTVVRSAGIALALVSTLGAGIAAAGTSAHGPVFATTTSATRTAAKPFTALITKSAVNSAKRTATFWFVARHEPASAFYCVLDDHGHVVAPPVKCLSPKQLKNLPLAAYTWSVYAVDESGAHSTTASRTFRIN